MTAIVLRPYQAALDDQIERCFAEGARGPCVVLPTGGGKTAIISTRLRRFVRAGERVAVLVHRTELIGQTIKSLQRVGVTSIGAIAAKLPQLRDESARVQVCSLQTLLARGTPLAVDRVVFDEAHHFADDSRWGAFGATYGHLPREGYTATPTRADGKGLRGLFDALAIGPSFADLVAMGFLVMPRIFSPPIHLGGRVAQSPVEFWLKHGCAGLRTIWFAKSKVHGAELEQAFEAAGYPARLIHDGTSQQATQRAFSEFLAGTLPVLTNVFRLTEGTDLPPTRVIGIARACDEDITYVQAVGRGARLAEGKDHYIVLDMTGATRKHGGPWIPRRYQLDGRGMTATESPDAWQCESCGGIPPTHKPGAPCPFCGYQKPKEERAATPSVTGDAMYEVGLGEGVGPRLDPEAAARAQAQADEDKREAKRARMMRNQVGAVDARDFGRSLQERLALWHGRKERKDERPFR